MGVGSLRRIEDGPAGGTPTYFGNAVVGQAVDAPIGQADAWTVGRPWNVARLADISLGQSAYQLSDAGRVWLPGVRQSGAVTVPICRLVTTKARNAPYHADINGATSAGDVRGPFNMVPIAAGSVPTYPPVWAHDTQNQRSTGFPPDRGAAPKAGRSPPEETVIQAKVSKVWEHASHRHFSRDFWFSSQTTAMQFTRRRSLGGRAWIAVRPRSAGCERALVLWSNTSLGLMLYWWHANKQQSGRGRIGVAPLDSLSVLDINAITPVHVEIAVKVFDDTRLLDLLLLNEIDVDTNARLTDKRFGVEVLGPPESMFSADGPFDIMRRKLAAEPSIQGEESATKSLQDQEDAEGWQAYIWLGAYRSK